ncbi:GM21197 [Drosophila sechellia]|uniref:GM21197 n=1 Tax=Drosophila sechellia TaxID=7238 RepID=B4HMF1_DROSE|nr:GM21197 [Drosophila sechellia]
MPTTFAWGSLSMQTKKVIRGATCYTSDVPLPQKVFGKVESLFMVTVADYVSAEKCFVPVTGGNANLVLTPKVRSQ